MVVPGPMRVSSIPSLAVVMSFSPVVHDQLEKPRPYFCVKNLPYRGIVVDGGRATWRGLFSAQYAEIAAQFNRISRCHASRMRGIQYPRGASVKHCRLWNTG